MRRIPEPELMDDAGQALAYARADFSEPHDHFVALFMERFGARVSGTVLDLGCGPGDICRRFARALPGCHILGIDAAPAMLALARADTQAQRLSDRVQFDLGRFPDVQLPDHHYDVLISNSLLHHLANPLTLWESLRKFGKPGAAVFVMDLMRPDDQATAARLVEQYAAGEPALLQRDFLNSLLAAYRPGEIRRQLEQSGLARLQVATVSDRHVCVSGRLG
jgi:ubiquinone/menaquinone biosynthesis C-methylase UbiE